MLDSLDTLIGFTVIYLVTSMLITIVVQLVSTVVNLRGENLAWGIAETFDTIEPDLATKAQMKSKTLADTLLKDTMLSDRQLWKFSLRATAVRPQELFDLLHRIATEQKTIVVKDTLFDRLRRIVTGKKKVGDTTAKNGVTALLDALGLDDAALDSDSPLVDTATRIKISQAATRTANDLITTLSAAVDALPDGPEKSAVINTLKTATADATTLAKNAAAEITQAKDNVEVKLTKAYQKFETWFESGQERARQWFVIHTKCITGVFALTFAFWFQLDAMEIYTLVSSNKSVRDKLVAQAGAVEAQATKLLADGKGTLTTALSKWKESVPNDLKEKIKNLEVSPTDTRGSLRLRVANALGDTPPPDDLLAKFDTAVDETAKADLAVATSDYKSVKTSLDKTGFEIYPSTSDGNRWIGNEWSEHIPRHIGGMLFSAGLLSLGAPFWFNLLKSMMNLRSTLAKSIDEEKEKDDDGEPGTGTPPATVVS